MERRAGINRPSAYKKRRRRRRRRRRNEDMNSLLEENTGHGEQN
jgi:hypothetical protein